MRFFYMYGRSLVRTGLLQHHLCFRQWGREEPFHYIRQTGSAIAFLCIPECMAVVKVIVIVIFQLLDISNWSSSLCHERMINLRQVLTMIIAGIRSPIS